MADGRHGEAGLVFWQSVAGQLVIGLGSNLLFLVILTAFGFGYVKLITARRSRPLREFLGIQRRNPGRVRILVSNMYVTQGGTLSPLEAETGYFGSVMNEGEYVFALRLAQSIQSKPVARLLRALLDQLGLSDAAQDPVTCSIALSPGYVDGRGGGPIRADRYSPPDLASDGHIVRNIMRALAEPGVHILVGGPLYNVAVLYVLTHLRERTRFLIDRRSSNTQRGISVVGYETDGSPRFFASGIPASAVPVQWVAAAEAPSAAPAKANQLVTDYFVVQKITGFGQTGSTVFLCAGLSSIGTALAMELVASHWEDLHDEFGGDDFALLYRHQRPQHFAPPSPEDIAVTLPSVVRVWPHDAGRL